MNRYIFCSNCGCRIDASKAQVFFDSKSGKPFCRNCSQNSSISTAKKVGRVLLSILRIFFAIRFYIFSFMLLFAGFFGFLLSLLLFISGTGLLVWQFWPKLKPVIQRRQERIAAEKSAKEHAAKENSRVKPCHHCGGYGTGSACPYCGMPFE